jgi:DNA-binding response OmpR family regulator
MEDTMKILVVDDDELIREILSEILKAHGFLDVTMAESGEDALSKVAAAGAPFDIFMFDIQMPGMDGIELCRQVRSFDIYRKSPVIMITAMNDKEYVDNAFRAGATDYVTKPFDTTELVTRLRLAERLSQETRRAERASGSVRAKPKPPFSASVEIEEIRGVVNSGILQNYLAVTLEQRQFPIGAFAIKVPELAVVHAGSSTEEFVYVVTDVAEVISDALVGAQAFTSYIGNGTFLCVGARMRFPLEEVLRDNLAMRLNNPDLVYCEDVSTSFSVTLGSSAAPKLFEKRGETQFLNRALDNLQAAEKMARPSMRQSISSGGLTGAFAA